MNYHTVDIYLNEERNTHATIICMVLLLGTIIQVYPTLII